MDLMALYYLQKNVQHDITRNIIPMLTLDLLLLQKLDFEYIHE